MLTGRVESTGAVSLAQAKIIKNFELSRRYIQISDVWRRRVRACDARMAARYPDLYGGDPDTFGARRSSPIENRNRRRRRSDSRDKKASAIIMAYEARAAAASLVPSVVSVSKSTHPLSTPLHASTPLSERPSSPSLTSVSTHSDAVSLPTPANDDDEEDLFETIGDGRSLPSWTYAGERLKLVCMFRAVAACSGGLAFNLNLCPAVEAKAKALGPDWLRRRVAHHLKAALGDRGVVLVLEATGGRKEYYGVAGRIHAHGIVEANTNEVAAVKAALKAAGGRWANPWWQEHQVVVKPLTDPDGWVRYCLEDKAHTRRVSGLDTLVSVSQSLKEPGRTVLKELRENISRKM